jgi:HAD superfamily hydrolase (TIGR01490 family)
MTGTVTSNVITRTVAVFDLDGTITHGDTYVAYLIHVLRHRPHRIPYCLPLPLLAARFGLGRAGNDEVKQRVLDMVAGGSRKPELDRITAAFIEPCLRRMAKQAALERIAMHAARGDTLVLATAGLDLYAHALGRRLGFHHVLATRVAWNGDSLARGLDGPNLRGDSKVAAVKQLLSAISADRPKVVAYSDHHTDLPLLRFADSAIAVDPTSRLEKSANELSIPIERWHR